MRVAPGLALAWNHWLQKAHAARLRQPAEAFCRGLVFVLLLLGQPLQAQVPPPAESPKPADAAQASPEGPGQPERPWTPSRNWPTKADPSDLKAKNSETIVEPLDPPPSPIELCQESEDPRPECANRPPPQRNSDPAERRPPR